MVFIPREMVEADWELIRILLGNEKPDVCYEGGPLAMETIEKHNHDLSLILKPINDIDPDAHEQVVFLLHLMDILNHNKEVIEFVYHAKIRTTRQLADYNYYSVIRALAKNDGEYLRWVENRLFALDASGFFASAKNIPIELAPIQSAIAKFFESQPNFDIRKTPVTKVAAALGVHQDVLNGLCEMQRTLAFTSTFDEFRALIECKLTSAFKIASMSVKQVIDHVKNPSYGGPIDAQAIHCRATAIFNRHQSVLTSMYQDMRGTGIAAIDGTVTENGRLNILGSVGGNTVNNVNFDELFGAMDSEPCDDCNSVTSPVAYFVEILQFLRTNNLDPATPPQQNVLDHLFARRPDLGDLQLTCPNTTAVLPYIDLANEVMESFVVHLDEQTPGDGAKIGKAKLDVHNCDGTSGELLSEPQNTNFGAYSILSTKSYPFHKLPYNHALDETRTFLNHLKTSRHELLETCYPGPSKPNGLGSIAINEVDEKNAAISLITEYLNLTHEEYNTLIGSNIDDERKYWGYKSDLDLLSTDESTHTGLRFIKAQFLPRAGIRFSDLVDLLKTEYINPMANLMARNTIVILHHGENDVRYRLIRSNGDPLDISDYRRIRQFIHLWHRIGWTIDQTDKAICALANPLEPPNPAEITAEVLEQLVTIVKLLKITKLEPSVLLTFWSPISMQGADSLYSRFFLTSGASRANPVLQLDEHGYFFPLAKIPQHEPLVMATLGLTKEGLHAIRQDPKIQNDDLSIENLSFLYRHALMAKFLAVTPTALFEVIKIFGNPFASPASCLDFVEHWNRMGDIGFTFAQLNYVVTGVDDPANPLALSEEKIREIIKSLLNGSAGHRKIDNPGSDDPGANQAPAPTALAIHNNMTKEQLEEDLVVATFSKALGLSIAITKELLSGLEHSEKKKALAIARSFMQYGLEKKSHDLAVAETVDATDQARADQILFASILPLLSRASIVISGFKLSAEEVKIVLANDAGFEGLTEKDSWLEGWKKLLAYSELRDGLPKGVDATLLDLLLPTDMTTKERVKKIAGLMLVREGTVESLLGRFGQPGKHFSLITLLKKLKQASDLAKKLAIDVDSLLRWGRPLTDFKSVHEIAQEIRGSIRARVTKEDWAKIVKPLEDQLRQNKRDALIAYLLVQPKLIEWGIIDADSLFEFFMIDVQMGPCFETTRIKQAISTVQLFVQRCFCGSEERYGVRNHVLDQKRWEWMKNYRMWEANRKVFLYPENWIEPSLRDDKSPVFLEFEADLVKKELDTKSMQDAVKDYISRVDAVSNLLPVTILTQQTAEDEIVLHLFARTRSVPYVFYYRSFQPKSSRRPQQWKAWEKMEVDIQYHEDPGAVGQGGVFLIPAVVGGRLIVFTPQIVEKAEKVEQVAKGKGTALGDTIKKVECYEIKLGWSEYRNGKWTPKRVSSEAVRVSQSEWDPDQWQNTDTRKLWQQMAGHEIRYLSFSLMSCTAEGAKMVVSLSRGVWRYYIGRFQFKHGCCTVTDNGKFDASDNPWRGLSGTMPRDRWQHLKQGTNYEYEFDMEVKRPVRSVRSRKVSKEGGIVETDGQHSINDNPPSLVIKTATPIPLTHESTALLTHTNPSATLDDLYAHLATAAKPPTAPGIPLNELATPFGLYDWELGLHAPMLLMDKLTSSQQYDKALEIARFVFNPMASGENDPSLLRVWKWAPFREISARRLLKRMVSQHRSSSCEAVFKVLSAFSKMIPSSGDPERIRAFYPELMSCSTDKLYTAVANKFEDIFSDDMHKAFSANDTNMLKHNNNQLLMVSNKLGLRAAEYYNLSAQITIEWDGLESDRSRMEVVQRILDPHLPPTNEIKAAAKDLGFNLPDKDLMRALGSYSSDMDISEFLRALPANTSNERVNGWRDSAFQPHVVARGRPVAYMTWMVMRYIKILIAAGDQLFRRATMESMPLAIQYYTMAAHLYGPPPVDIPKHTKTTPKTFNSLIDRWDAFSNAMVTFENAFPFANSVGPNEAKATDNTGFGLGYFCVPRNPAIRGLRTQIDDRLFKIRHCQDINGVTRKLALWEPPIDPGAFVRAAAAGLSLSSVMTSISGPMPNYRFQYLLRGALELIQELKSLAGAFLGAKEKMDSEAYQRIRAGHESTINAMLLDLKKLSLDEANRAIESLRNSRDGPLARANHYLQLIGEAKIKTNDDKFWEIEDKIPAPKADAKAHIEGGLKLTANEALEITKADDAADHRKISNYLAVASAMTLIVPTTTEEAAPMGVGISVGLGVQNIAEGIRGGSLIQEGQAAESQHLSDVAARANSLVRQYQDRVLQANSAGHELNAINAQIKVQEVRVSIVEKDIELQEKHIEEAKATEEFLHSKYTNKELYSWQETQLRTLHYQTYIVAYDLAKKVEKSYQFERGPANDTNFIVGGWDNSRDGLLSAEGLGLGLRRLEAAYQESRGHDFEITKHISLRQIDPKALLQLRKTNSCTFSLSQTLFDMDFAHHHMRRLKSVSLSLPCVVGPYTSVNCTLQLKKHCYQLGATGHSTTDRDANYVPINRVAFSSGQNDPGVFELNFHDERYLPFEGAGAISTWELSLPEFRTFDYDTISDAVMHLRYTSIVGSTSTSMFLKSRGGDGDDLYASFDLRNEFASTWQQLASGEPMVLSDLAKRLPWWTTNYEMKVQSIHLFPSTTGKSLVASNGFVFRMKPEEGEAQVSSSGATVDGMMSFAIPSGITKFGTWGLTMAKQNFPLADLWMVVQYTATVKS